VSLLGTNRNLLWMETTAFRASTYCLVLIANTYPERSP